MVVVPSGIKDYPYQISSGRALRFDIGVWCALEAYKKSFMSHLSPMPFASPQTKSPDECYEGIFVPDFEAYTLKGERVAKCLHGILTIGHPYAWNGCTGLPKWMETEETLKASCLHDLLYQLHQNNPCMLSDRGAVDALFLSYCPRYYRPIFRAALAIFGGIAWNKTTNSLIIKTI